MTNRSKPVRAVFIGGLTDGRRCVEVLQARADVELVGAFVLDAEAGRSVSGFRSFDDLVAPERLFEMKHVRDEVERVLALEPELVFVVGFSQIVPKRILAAPRLGVVGFHTSLLPERSGCSPVIWAILDGVRRSGVTMLYLSSRIDAGDIIDQEPFAITEGEKAADVLARADDATLALLERNLDALLDGSAPRRPQVPDAGSSTRKRTPADGEIDWSRPARDIIRLVNALSEPYPLAHAFGGDGQPVLFEGARPGAESLPRRPAASHDPLRARVLCIAAHPDDEVLGLAGTLALHSRAGGEVVTLVLSEGESEKLDDKERCEDRRACARAAGKLLGARDVVFGDLPDQRFDQVPFIDVIRAIEQLVREHRPEIVYTHHRGDANTDHQIAFKATYAACRPMSAPSRSVRKLLCYETPSSTEQAPAFAELAFIPNVYVDVESTWDRKLEALSCYPTEILPPPHPRSLESIAALAVKRGAEAGCGRAEAFALVRESIAVRPWR